VKNIKRILVLVLTMILIVNTLFLLEVKAQIPSDFWALNTEYQTAIDNGDNNNIVYYGGQIINLFRPFDYNNSQGVSICAGRSGDVATAYEALGQYEDAIEYFKEYIPLATYMGWTEGVYNAQMKILHLAFNPDLYIKGSDVENNVFYNAKNEPKSGTYAGIVPYIEPEFAYKNIADKTGSYLCYYSYGRDTKTFYTYYTSTMQKAEQEKKSVEFAFNVYSESDFRNILNEKAFIEELVDFFASYNVPVFLRFGGEMNDGENCNDPQAFIDSFRFVSNIVKARSTNIAMVFGPLAASPYKHFQDYYPGDEYVDWVGLSLYELKYFMGNKLGVQNANDSYFLTGEYANPLTAIELIANEYGGRKPIMLTECGVSNYTKSPYIEEDLVSNQWAQTQFERLYSFAPMIYPQLKLMNYFNVDRTAYEDERYSLFNSPVMAKLYNDITAADNFLGATNVAPSFRYEKVIAYKTSDTVLRLSTYAVYPKTLALQVQYWIDGQLVNQTDTIPYDENIDTTTLSTGTHTLEVNIVKDGTVIKNMRYQIVKDAGQVVLKKENVFEDVTANSFEWAKSQIENLTADNVINGVEMDGKLYYKPEQNITRAEYAKLVVKALNINTANQTSSFSDVSNNIWYYSFVSAAFNAGIIKGRVEGTNTFFAPNEPITRQDMCVIISNAMIKINGMQMLDENATNAALNVFGDKSDVAAYARQSVAFTIVNGIVKGSDNAYGVRNFRPQDNANKAEAAIVVMNSLTL
jgi:hypothetical protein